MKKYTILENAGGEVMMIPSAAIYTVAYFYYSLDRTYILEDGELRPTDGFYSTDYCEDGTKFVVKVEDIRPGDESTYAGMPHLTIKDDWDEDLELVDVSEWCKSYVWGKAVDIAHGINSDTVYFDCDDDEDGWKSVDEVTADYEIEHEQHYPDQELTRIYTCSNGRKIRETSPFFTDEQREVYEYVD